MKKLLLFLLLSSFPMFAQKIEKVTLQSEAMGQERQIWIYTPEEYAYDPEGQYEVAYVFDAQAREYFDFVHSSTGFLSNYSHPMIVVGIVSEERNRDFFPVNENEETFKDYYGYLGNADKLIAFLYNEVVPYIESHYRALPVRLGIGHSNGGTFLSYCLLKKPELFDAYIAISPNLAYDKEQIVRRFAQIESDAPGEQKYFYMCNASEKGGWIAAREKMATLMDGERFKDRIHFVNEDFSASEGHTSVFPQGFMNGFRGYMEFRYKNGPATIAHYKKLEQEKHIALNSDKLNSLAYVFFGKGKISDAKTIIAWAIERFPQDSNLYDSLGEFYEKEGDNKEAAAHYKKAMSMLEGQKAGMDKKDFEDRYSLYKGNYDRAMQKGL